MARLIDADELIKLLQKNMTNDIQDQIITENNINLINLMPTAYNVEKVVAELEDAKFLMPPENDNHYADNGLFLEDAIDIVKRGGVE